MRIRPRRNRQNASVRALVRETQLSPSDFVWPVFVQEGESKRTAIEAMPGCFRLSIDEVVKEAREAYELGIPGVALFPVVEDEKKDRLATESHNDKGLMQRAIRALKEGCPELLVFADVAMDPYSSDGHDGIVESGEILNDATLEVLGKMAVSQAAAGADFVAPSDMMDGRVDYLRKALDKEGFEKVGIMAYSAKYASAFYGPFREALDSAPKSGDKKTYQMDPANSMEAIREVELDLEEGADIVMVKPALSYLDVIQTVKSVSSVPVAAYNVSGEYAMIEAAAEKGWIDREKCILEKLTSMKRAGADVIFTYYAKEAAQLLK